MSHIERLIAELCPDGVEFRSLTTVADYVRGITYNKAQEQPDGPTAVLRANNITLFSNTLNFDDIKHVSAEVRVRDNQRLRPGDILICAGSGSRDHIGKVAYIDKAIPHTFGGFMAIIRSRNTLVPRFLFHLLTSWQFTSYLQQSLTTTTINNLNSSLMAGFQVPVPPMEVQREIVRILDNFSQLEAELEAELEARRKQYEFYRDRLLTFREATHTHTHTHTHEPGG